MWNASSLGATVTASLGRLMADKPSSTPAYIVGHSMGGALAQLAALDVRFAGAASRVHVYTFGAPRIGNDAFADVVRAYTQEAWRFTHNRDIVPSVPLQARARAVAPILCLAAAAVLGRRRGAAAPPAAAARRPLPPLSAHAVLSPTEI
jgi:pimeloyl-ACP methyl ester carboxylesterase